MVLGHNLSEGIRTQDVQISADVSFDTMLLRSSTLNGLRNAGFFKPSPVQLHGIPLGKCGFDLLLEAKSGTGKTAVFTVIALEKLDLNKGVQAIMLAPTREIASQISDVITAIGSNYKGLNVVVVMGGLPVKDDIEKFKENVHIVVGSPGRLRHLIQDHIIDVSSVRLFVLDEADKLLESSFLPDINYIFSLLPKQKQVIMSSATYSEETRLFINKYVQKAQHVCPDSNSVLLGIEQKVAIVIYHSNIVKQTKNRYQELKKILNGKQFKQCLIFCNYQVRVGELHRMLTRDKWPAEQLYGQQHQTDRLDALKVLQEYKCRILVSTDLAARGIDASNVDLVINFEPPSEWQTYLHRIGRAGRYGSYGTAISIISDGEEKRKFKETLASTKIPFKLRDLWSDKPFHLNINNAEESLEVDTAPVINFPKKKISDENLLWKLLTTEASERKMNENSDEISTFQGLCDSFKMSSEPNIECFSELMHSFTVNEIKPTKQINNFKYKYLEVTKLPFEIIKHWENVGSKTPNKITETNGHTSRINTSHTNENSKRRENSLNFVENLKQQNKSILSVTVYKDSTTALNCNGNIPKHNVHIKTKLDIASLIQQSQSDKSKTEQSIITSGLSTASGKPENKLSRCKDSKTEQSIITSGLSTASGKPENKSSRCNNSKTEQSIITSGMSTVSGKSETKSSRCNDNISKNNIHTETPQSYIEREKQRNFKPIRSYSKQPGGTEIDATEQAMIDAGLPTAFGKPEFKENFREPVYNNKHSKSVVSKRHTVENKPVKNQINYEKEIKNTSLNKMKSNFQNNCLSRTVKSSESELSSDIDEESNQSDYSSKTSDGKQVTWKSRKQDNYTSNNGSQTSSKSYSNTHTLKKSRQFDVWYNQLKQQMQLIQYTLYVEELRK